MQMLLRIPFPCVTHTTYIPWSGVCVK